MNACSHTQMPVWSPGGRRRKPALSQPVLSKAEGSKDRIRFSEKPSPSFNRDITLETNRGGLAPKKSSPPWREGGRFHPRQSHDWPPAHPEPACPERSRRVEGRAGGRQTLEAIREFLFYPRLQAGEPMPHPSGWGLRTNFRTSSRRHLLLRPAASAAPPPGPECDGPPRTWTAGVAPRRGPPGPAASPGSCPCRNRCPAR